MMDSLNRKVCAQCKAVRGQMMPPLAKCKVYCCVIAQPATGSSHWRCLKLCPHFSEGPFICQNANLAHHFKCTIYSLKGLYCTYWKALQGSTWLHIEETEEACHGGAANWIWSFEIKKIESNVPASTHRGKINHYFGLIDSWTLLSSGIAPGCARSGT